MLKQVKVKSQCQDNHLVLWLKQHLDYLWSLWQQGLQEIKLEGISCFGCNMIILLHANIPKGKIPDDHRGIFMYGSILRYIKVIGSCN